MIHHNEPVLNKQHIIWQNLVGFYKDSDLTYSNASLIGIGIFALQNSQFDTRMTFLAKHTEELHCYNAYS